MMSLPNSDDSLIYDAIVIGGGFYGAAIAVYLAERRNFSRVLLIEREADLLTRASYNNQARVHNGYHYPRSFTTAYRSRINLPWFVHDYPQTVMTDFTKIYAIARNNSKVTSKQFVRFCQVIGAKIELAPQPLHQLFERRLIEDVFLVQEYAFDADKLRAHMKAKLLNAGINLQLNTKVNRIGVLAHGGLNIDCESKNADRPSFKTRYAFNCSYSGLNQIYGDFPGTTIRLKHEIAEMALIQAPKELTTLGVTVMDGPFFSMMPFPARRLHTLSHVRYTPHMHWADDSRTNPYEKLSHYDRDTRVDKMVRDAARYMPAISEAKYVDSLFEVKTVLTKNETDDGRPILFEQHQKMPNCYSILGGKIDNIYDILEKLDTQRFELV